MAAYEADVLVSQLSQLGRDLQHEVTVLGRLEEETADAEGAWRHLDEEHGDQVAQAFLGSDGSVERRKMQARLKAVPARLTAEEAWLEWRRLQGRIRTQEANLRALHRRIEVGRSLLSREKSLLSLAGIGET